MRNRSILKINGAQECLFVVHSRLKLKRMYFLRLIKGSVIDSFHDENLRRIITNNCPSTISLLKFES